MGGSFAGVGLRLVEFRGQPFVVTHNPAYVVERRKRNSRKSAISLQLRILRDAKGMTQADVSEATGMTEHCIARLESLAGSLPSIVDLDRFVSACDGKIDVVISLNESDE